MIRLFDTSNFKTISNSKLIVVSFAVFILTLLAGVYFESHNLNTIFHKQKEYAKIINKAGKQRMLSQRIALYILKIQKDSIKSLDALKKMAKEFESNHDFLVNSCISDSINILYFQKPTYLNKKTLTFIENLNTYVSNPNVRRLSGQLIEESNDILPDLNHATYLFQLESEEITQDIIYKRDAIIKRIIIISLVYILLFVIPTILRIRRNDKKLLSQTKDLKDFNADLQEKDSLIELALDKNGLAYWSFDLVNNKREFSNLGYQVLGIENRDDVSLDNWGDIIHPDDAESVMKDYNDLLSGKIDQYENLHRIITTGDHYIWNKVTATSVVKDGKIVKVIGFFKDVTEEIRKNEELIQAKEEAVIANKLKSEFLANMSHEIRTPMNSITGFSEQLVKSVKDEKQLSQIKAIHNSGKTLLRIINDILDISKIEANKLELNPTPVDLRIIATEIKDIFSLKCQEKNIELFIEYDIAFHKTLILDEARIRQILFNLVGNAIKFTHEGEVILRFEVERIHADTELVSLKMIITDTGIGIPEDQLEQMFNPFIQQKNQSTAKYGGTGLGLSITRKLVEKMNGEIKVTSELGSGSEFTVVIPDIEVSDIEIEIEEQSLNLSDFEFRSAKILVVDDNFDNRKLVVDLFDESPLEVFEAVNGEEGVEKAVLLKPDLILMDIRMPMMDGFEAAKRIREHESTSNIPIIAITASVKGLEEKSLIEEEFDEFIYKPVVLDDLLNKMRKYLDYQKEDDADLNIIDSSGKQLDNVHLSSSFKKKLRLELLDEYQKVVRSQMMDDIEVFNQHLLEMAQEENNLIFIEYSKELTSLINNFEFDKLIIKLKNFPKMIKK